MTATATSNTATSAVTIVIADDAAAAKSDAPPPTTTRGIDGSVNFENQNYEISVSEEGEVSVLNKTTQETYTVSPTLNVAVDGDKAFDVKGVTTLNLDDGTRITITTERLRDANYTRMSSTVIVVDGAADYALKIEGLRKDTGLRFQESDQEGAADWVVEETNVIMESEDGSGFVAIDEDGVVRPVDQAWIDETDITITSIRDIYNDFSANSFKGLMRVTYVAAMYTSTFEQNWRPPETNAKSAKRESRSDRQAVNETENITTQIQRPDGSRDFSSKPVARVYQFAVNFQS
jgi:hypothetical protein